MLKRYLPIAVFGITALAWIPLANADAIPAANGAVTLLVATIAGKPIAMEAFFTPDNGLSLSDAAAALGYTEFEWQQTITNWPNPDLHSAAGSLLAPVPPNSPIQDPPLGGYSYSPCGPASPAAASADPFYYGPPTIGPSTDCFSLVFNQVNNNTTLRFGDLPMDHQLSADQIAIGNIPEFTTDLVGVLPDGSIVPLLEWQWNTTYNGSTGGISRSANSPFDSANFPDFCPTCTGQVTITSINGVPVPEPSPFIAFASSVLALLGLRRSRARMPPHT